MLSSPRQKRSTALHNGCFLGFFVQKVFETNLNFRYQSLKKIKVCLLCQIFKSWYIQVPLLFLIFNSLGIENWNLSQILFGQEKNPKASMILANPMDNRYNTNIWCPIWTILPPYLCLFRDFHWTRSNCQVSQFLCFYCRKILVFKDTFSLLKKCLAFTRLLERLKIV